MSDMTKKNTTEVEIDGDRENMGCWTSAASLHTEHQF